MLLRPNVPCVIYPVVGMDAYGREKLGDAVAAECGLVKLAQRFEKTTVRADSSASRGTAEEMLSDARLLFPASTDIKQNYKVEILGFVLRAQSVFPRYSVGGEFDHWQVDLMIWGNG